MSVSRVARLANTVRIGLRGRLERRVPYLPAEVVERMQRHRIRRAVAHAYRTVPFYREALDVLGLRPSAFRTSADLARLPLIDGPYVVRHTEQFLSKAASLRTTYELTSTGTSQTGQKRVVWDRSALLAQAAHGERDRVVLRRLLGRVDGLRRLSLFPAESSTAEVTRFHRDQLLVPRSFASTRSLSSQTPYDEVAETIRSFRPHVVYSYGSIAEGFLRHAAALGISFEAPRVWVVGGDAISPQARAMIESRFGCLVHSTYQAVEAGRIGFQCEERDGFHLNVDLCAVRIAGPEGCDVAPGDVGEVVISTLVNPAMALLNYRLGDLGALSTEPCRCGRSLPRLARLEGRTSAVLHVADGRDILDHVLTHAYKDVLDATLGFQVVERERGDFLWRVVPAPGADCQAIERGILDAARRVVGPGDRLAVEFVDELERGPFGKLDRVVRGASQSE